MLKNKGLEKFWELNNKLLNNTGSKVPVQQYI